MLSFPSFEIARRNRRSGGGIRHGECKVSLWPNASLSDIQFVSTTENSLIRKSCQAGEGRILLVMSPKAQHNPAYKKLPPFLRALREKAGLTQRGIGERLKRPQSFVFNCEVGNRRVDVAEFAAWAKACGVDPTEAFQRLMDEM